MQAAQTLLSYKPHPSSADFAWAAFQLSQGIEHVLGGLDAVSCYNLIQGEPSARLLPASTKWLLGHKHRRVEVDEAKAAKPRGEVCTNIHCQQGLNHPANHQANTCCLANCRNRQAFDDASLHELDIDDVGSLRGGNS